MILWEEYTPKASTRHAYLSGVEINQNQTPTTSVVPTDLTYQTFFLPNNFKRGGTHGPDLTGLQLCFDVEDAETFSANISLDVNEFGDWVEISRGSVVEAHTAGENVWVDAYFNLPIPLVEERLERQFRIGVQSDSPVWNDGDLLFRLLTGSADSGEDFLGNSFRSVLLSSPVDSVRTVAAADANTFWLSKPNPSRFAVESLYFDVRNNVNSPSVVDRIFADPITPGIFFSLYYTNEGAPGTTDAEWDNKLWQPVYQTFHLERRGELALREPIAAKYVKVEFTHLQPQFYQAGTFQQPIRYQKHPKWVLDYFVTRLTVDTDDVMIAHNVKVVNNVLSLAYTYIRDENEPTTPILAQDAATFLADRNDVSDQVDAETMDRISTELRPYTRALGSRASTSQGVLAALVQDSPDRTYPVERPNKAQANTRQVSSLDRFALVVENEMPVMFFYVTARHKYRELEANFEEDRAYFAGVREFAFIRDHYTVASDASTYVDNLSDFSNVLRNDFIEVPEDFEPFVPNPEPDFGGGGDT